MSTKLEILLFGKTYLLLGDLEKGGAIATVEQYTQGKCSFAHLGADGTIRRFYKIIGTTEDIQITGKQEVQITIDAFVNLVSNLSWEGPEEAIEEDKDTS